MGSDVAIGSEFAAAAASAQRFSMPLVAFAAVGLLALVLYWSQTPRRRRSRTTSNRGLLVPVARVPDRGAANRLATRLRSSGIRSTLSPAEHGVDVLVWQEQYGEARLQIREADPEGGAEHDP